MKRTLTLALLLACALAFGQNEVHKCWTHEHAMELMKNNPEYRQQYQDYEAMLQQISENALLKTQESTQSVPRVIPVVFHVIHEGGAENISKAQILDQIRILNEDFIRANPDTVNTPAPFAAVAANCNIEFRLAQKDPSGNCTDGIVRIFSSQTNNANDNTKALSYWPSNRYLNVWVVKSIESTSGVILGYAQFPGFGSPTTDGVMIRHDCIGSIGTAPLGPFSYEVGRVATHEVGHWLGLRHVWGDANCGNDFVADTPQAQAANSGCPSFPHDANICTNTGANGEMYPNYMDYSNGNCLNLFTAGQKAIMDATLAGTRQNIPSPSNLNFTGTNGTPAVLCAPKADFLPQPTRFICAGASVSFTSIAYNGQPTSWSWNFPGGTPSTSTDSTPLVVYNTPGVYNVSLTVSNTAGSHTKTINNVVYVSPATAMYSGWQFYEGFDVGGPIPNNDWWVLNPNGNNTWAQTTNGVYYSPNNCIMVNNVSSMSGQIDEVISPSVNLSQINNPSLYFKVAYAQKNSSNGDRLRVFVSTNCGQTWTLRMTKLGTNLATVPAQTSPFLPSQVTQWRMETVSLTSFATQQNVRFKFEFLSDGGNHIYLDDINVSGPLGGTELEQQLGFAVYPNPSSSSSVASFTLPADAQAAIMLYDMTGRETQSVFSGHLKAGEHSFVINPEGTLGKGIYLLKVVIDGNVITRKIIIH
ncbi:MAG: choice-of-anchor J domain-containing protein [Bacteroidota bacterium]